MDFAYSHFTGFGYLFRFDVDLGNATILHALELAEGGSATEAGFTQTEIHRKKLTQRIKWCSEAIQEPLCISMSTRQMA